MDEVFINYRTGDGDKTAALLDQELKRRFGPRHVFRASRSIAPGEDFTDALPDALRHSRLLLAVIGPDWTNFRSRLSDPEDWVRKEILRAFEYELPVVPVLDGRRTARLDKADLPPELARLADLQSLPFDTHDVDTCVTRIGDLVAEMVPELDDLSRSGAADGKPAAPGSVRNSAGDVSGVVIQSGEFTGDVGNTVVKGTQGPVHTGSGDINTRHYSGGRYISGDGMTYVEGDNHGEAGHHFDARDRHEDGNR